MASRINNMTFEKINNNPDCDCITQSMIDTENQFVRKLRGTTLVEKDFHSHWEREIGRDEIECEKVCSYKGISINMFTSEHEEMIFNKYKTTFSINPKKGAYCLKFKFKDGAGKVKFASEDDDNTHYNLYKSDSFTLDHLDIIETVKFA
jgi:hypothetical protein